MSKRTVIIDPIIVCLSCANYLGFTKCKAYLKGIPQDIATGKRQHINSAPGDNGIRYEEAK